MFLVEYFYLQKALRALPSETRLTVYRRSRVLRRSRLVANFQGQRRLGFLFSTTNDFLKYFWQFGFENWIFRSWGIMKAFGFWYQIWNLKKIVVPEAHGPDRLWASKLTIFFQKWKITILLRISPEVVKRSQ